MTLTISIDKDKIHIKRGVPPPVSQVWNVKEGVPPPISQVWNVKVTEGCLTLRFSHFSGKE